jgi:hypothetical protein
MNITWTIDWLRTTPTTAIPPEYVISCGWRCTGTDGQYTGTVYSTCSFTQAAEADGTYTPYADLTQEQVLGWCWDSGVPKEATEANVAQQIETQKNPTEIQPPLPWSTPAPATKPAAKP